MAELIAPATDTTYSGETRKSFAAWQRDAARSFLPLRISLPATGRFSAHLRAAGTDSFYLSEISASSHTVERTKDLIANSGANYFKLSLQLAGTGLIMQGDRKLVLQPGEMTIYDTSRPYSIVFDDDFRFLVAVFPRNAEQLRSLEVAELSAVRLDGTTGVGSLVSTFLTGLSQNLGNLSGPTGRRLSLVGLDLIGALAADHFSDNKAGHKSVLKRQIYAFMSENLSDEGLDPGRIAAANFISVRLLHNLFRDEGSTVAAWIRQQRLERCRQDLGDPTYLHLSVSDIAARWGMRDPGHFSKMFRAAYNHQPSQWRSLKATNR